MRISIARLRVWLIVGAALLVLVIAGFLGYARYRTHRFLAGLPGRLGIDIRRETNGYTYSQSVGGKTVMTLHASKAVEHTNGKITLHDVSMILYGRKQDRADQISGSEFEYEQASGVVRAVGEVHIDLQASAAAESRGAVKQAGHPVDNLEGENKRVIHVKTSGLVYLQKLGVAATDQDLEFRFGGMTGHAHGAEYNSDTGVLILQTEVKTSGLQHGRPVVLTASHAELDRQSKVSLLTMAKYASPGQTARADHAIVHLRSDGSPERIEAEGNVALASPTAGRMTAPHADVLLNQAGQAQNAHFFSGVSYEDLSSLREGRGQAQEVRVAFDAAGQPENVVLTGAVHLNERVRAAIAAASPWSIRDATAGRMSFALTSDMASHRKVLREMEAATSAHLLLVSDAGTEESVKSDLTGDLLRGEFTGSGKEVQLSKLHGTGHTSLRRLSAGGAEETSVGDMLEVSLRPASRSNAKGSGAGGHAAGQASGEQIAKAVQSGHVTLTSTAARKAGATAVPELTRAVAEVATYDGDADNLTLTGNPEVFDAASTIAASKVILEHKSGDALALGEVKANYVQPNSTEPVHVLADHAELKHDERRAIFYGTASRPARLWQGASQVEAPMLDLDQQQRMLTASGGAAAAGPAPVHAVLVSTGAKEGSPPQAKGAAGRRAVVRVASRTMVYRDLSREVDFNGDVKVEDTDGVLRAQQAMAYLQPASASKSASAASKTDASQHAGAGVSLGGGVERIVAKGKVEVDQPGRRAVGEQLVYTASDGMFVLMGTPGSPPKLIDEVQGTVTGDSLRFHTGDDSVSVTGGADHSGQRVHTVTRVKQK